MAQRIAPDYGQQFLFPPSIEDLLPADHPARFLREFVDELDLPDLGFVISNATEGRPSYAPSLLLKIWLYGYYHRIRSTRKLEVACSELLPLMWLCGLLAPDHNSLWRFWRDNKKALRKVFKLSVQVAVRAGAVGLAVQAVDGTKIQSASSNATGWSREYMEKLLAALDQSLKEMELKIVEENSQESHGGLRLPEGLAEREALRQEIQKGLAQLDVDGRGHYHRQEPEARVMKLGENHRFAHNAQVVTDAKEGVIVACDVTRQETDHGALVPMIEQAKENVAVAESHPVTLADTGYGGGADLLKAKEAGYEVLAPPVEGRPAGDNPYATKNFKWDAHNQTVTCPRGVQLDYEGCCVQYEGRLNEVEQKIQRYRCRCQDCPVKAQCTKDPKGRRVEVRPHTGVVQEMRERLRTKQGGQLYSKRSTVVEPSFARIKEHEGFRRWTVRGTENVKTQWSLVCTTMNLHVLYRKWRDSRTGGSGTSGALAAVMIKGGSLRKQLQEGLTSLQDCIGALARTRTPHWILALAEKITRHTRFCSLVGGEVAPGF